MKSSSTQTVCRWIASLGAISVVTLAHRADAYPTSIVFVPTGETLPAYGLTTYVFGSVPLDLAAEETTVTPWAGVQVGTGPSVDDGESRSPHMGGLELGLDVLGTGGGDYKLVLNLKAGVLAQWGDLGPSLAVGVMQFAPADLDHSMNLVYAVATRAVTIRGTELGAVTLGLARSLRPAPPPGEEPVFQGTFPFSASDRSALLLGYASPSWGPVSLCVDHFGGYSEASSLNASANVALSSWLLVSAGPYFSLDRSTPHRSDGAFLNLSATLDLGPSQQGASAQAHRHADPLTAARR